ncbi:MAG: sterol desaturase family protein [Flammeovirgaceae bacterium]|nr:sterol desaturase family protein [Flammeovirgaceae bacterium]
MDLSPVILSIPVYFILISFELIYTLLKRADYYRFSDAVTNISCGVGDQLIGVFAKVFTIGIYQFIYENFRVFDIENTILSFVIVFILADFLYYWSHRLSHEVNFLWAGHVVHHQSEEYNLSVALRQSWFHKFFTFAFYLPLAFMGFDTIAFIWANGLNLLYQFWIHTEMVGKMGFLENFMNTPSHHRVHHGRNPEYIDRNHAGVFIIWDKIFGTFEPEKITPVYGITTPVNSWNPVWVNVMPWTRISNEIKMMKSFKDKIKVIYKPPGWRPLAQGGTMKIPEVNRESYLKFKTVAPRTLNFYIFVQYAIAIGATAFFLFQQANFNNEQRILGASLIFLSIMNLGMMLERKRWSFILEFFRIIFTLLFIAYSFHELPIFKTILLSTSGIAFISLFWLITLSKYFKK